MDRPASWTGLVPLRGPPGDVGHGGEGSTVRCNGLRAAVFIVAACAAADGCLPVARPGRRGGGRRAADRARLARRLPVRADRAGCAPRRPVSEVERPALYRLVRELSRAARLPVPRLFVSPASQPNILTVGSAPARPRCAAPRACSVCSPRPSCAPCSLTSWPMSPGGRRRRLLVGGPGLAAGPCPLIAVMLDVTARAGREYGADIYAPCSPATRCPWRARCARSRGPPRRAAAAAGSRSRRAATR